MNIFESIHYERRLENFCTEILVGILSRGENYELLETFCSNELLLNIPEAKNDKSIKIEAQIFYPRINPNVETEINYDIKNSYIDIQISGAKFLCFLEMKVGNNGLCNAQLEKYEEVLVQKSKDFSLEPYLRFCSRIKNNLDFITKAKNFKAIRWQSIYSLLKYSNNRESEIINDFLLFLDSKNMSSATSLEGKIIDVNELSFYHSLKFLNKLEIVLNEIRQLIDESGKVGVKSNDGYLDFVNNRYGLHYQFIKTRDLKDFENKNPQTSLFIGFDFNSDIIKKNIWLWSSNYSLSSHKFNILEQNCYQAEPLEAEELVKTVNWFLQNETLKEFL